MFLVNKYSAVRAASKYFVPQNGKKISSEGQFSKNFKIKIILSIHIK